MVDGMGNDPLDEGRGEIEDLMERGMSVAVIGIEGRYGWIVDIEGMDNVVLGEGREEIEDGMEGVITVDVMGMEEEEDGREGWTFTPDEVDAL